MNPAESKTLAAIRAAGTTGALVSTLDLRHLGRLDRRGLVVAADPAHVPGVGARARAVS